MNQFRFAINLYRIPLDVRPKHRFRKEYNEALDLLNVRGHWLYLYDSLDGPNGEQVCEALKAWMEAYQAKKDGDRDAISDEKRLKRHLHLLIYDEFAEGEHGYVSDDDL
uniref:Uncharacterized protein n=1 Tax=viral metagenome TaxID=1070528 RepID=A0A6C0AIX7_9ZZZZ